MAWKIEIGPTGALQDRTAWIKLDEGVDIGLTYNERSTASFTTLHGYMPSLRDEVRIYEQDGATVIFGGLVYQRQSQGPTTRTYCACDCADWSLYGDWCYTDVVYASDTTLQVVLDDLIANCLGAYGITLDAVDYTGVTLAAFGWSNKCVTDALRELSERTGYIWRFSVNKVLSLILPGAVAAAWNISDAAPHVTDLQWRDSSENYASKVRVVCGPDATIWSLQTWTTVAGEVSWVTDLPAAGPTAGYATVDGIFKTVGLPGEEAAASYIWTYATHTLSLGTAAAPAAGTVISLSYLAQYPFTVTADSGASPAVEYLTTAPDVMSIAAGQEIADELLAKLAGTVKELTFTTLDAGLVPGTAMSVQLSVRSLNLASVFLQTVNVHLRMATWWEYSVTAIEGDNYLGSYLDYWRKSGGDSGVAVVGGASGSVTVASASTYYLGGSRFHAVQVPEA